jgi:phage antirepressor YoqD-like protein/phage regulator Rha-like protein
MQTVFAYPHRRFCTPSITGNTGAPETLKAPCQALSERNSQVYTENNIQPLNCQFETQAMVKDQGFSYEPSMTTVEIAELTQKRHDNILADTRKMLIELYDEQDRLKFQGIYLDAYNREKPCYRLPKKEVMVLVSGYSIRLRMKIITRLEELEKRAGDPMAALNDPAIMRQILLGYTEKVLALEETVKEQAPKAAALDRIATANGSMNITAAAKHLQLRPKDLFGWLSANKWIYRRNGNKSYLAYQNRIQQGVMEHKITSYINGDGIEQIHEQARVTPKGIVKLAETFETALV